MAEEGGASSTSSSPLPFPLFFPPLPLRTHRGRKRKRKWETKWHSRRRSIPSPLQKSPNLSSLSLGHFSGGASPSRIEKGVEEGPPTTEGDRVGLTVQSLQKKSAAPPSLRPSYTAPSSSPFFPFLAASPWPWFLLPLFFPSPPAYSSKKGGREGLCNILKGEMSGRAVGLTAPDMWRKEGRRDPPPSLRARLPSPPTVTYPFPRYYVYRGIGWRADRGEL